MRFTLEQIGERIRLMKGIVIEHEQVRLVQDELEMRISEGAAETDSAALTMMVAPSGCGKSNSVKQAKCKLEANPKYSNSALPILCISFPAQCTVKNVTTELLRGLNDPLADRHSTIGRNNMRIIDQLRGQKVQLGIIDEFQHIMQGTNDKTDQVTADWLKQLLDKSGVPFVCVGLPASLGVIARHDQLQRRTARVIRMTPFGWDHGGEESDKLRALLSVYESQCGFSQPSNLGDYETSARIWKASGGLIGTITQLAREAARASMSRSDGPDCITTEDFANAYAGLPFEQPNPFDPRKKIEEIIDNTPVTHPNSGPRNGTAA